MKISKKFNKSFKSFHEPQIKEPNSVLDLLINRIQERVDKHIVLEVLKSSRKKNSKYCCNFIKRLIAWIT